MAEPLARRSQILQINSNLSNLYFFAIEICMICEDLKDFFASKASKLDNSPQATQKDDSLNCDKQKNILFLKKLF